MKQIHQPLGIDQCHCFTMRKAARQISRFYDAHLAPTGLRITQFLTLAALAELGHAAVNELAVRLDIERTAMGKMAGFLERDGLVTITPSPADARSRVIALTPLGAKLHERTAPLWQAAQREFAALNGADRVSALHHGLGQMVVGEGTAAQNMAPPLH